MVRVNEKFLKQITLLSKDGLGDPVDGYGARITNIANPTAAQDAATKNYVDSAIASAGDLSSVLDQGNTTDGYDISLTGGSDILLASGSVIRSVDSATPADFSILGGAGTGSATGASVAVSAGDNSGTGNGGQLSLNGGDSSDANGGAVVITGGDGDIDSGTGGNITIITGEGNTSGSFSVSIPEATGNAGNISLSAGDADSAGGNVTITTGDSINSTGGNFTVTTGTGLTTGGDISLTAAVNGDVSLTTSGTGKTKIFGDGYVSQDFEITGKLTVGGLIDPTGLKLTPQASEPDGESTIWVSSVDGYLYYNGIVGGSSPNKRLLSEGYTDTDDIINSSTASGTTLTDALNALSNVAPTLSNVLDYGNTTDGYDIRISDGDELVFEGVGTIRMDGYNDFSIQFTNKDTGSAGAGVNITTQESTNNLSGVLSLTTGQSINNSTGSGALNISSGYHNSGVSGNTGLIQLRSGDNTTTGNTGEIQIESGNAETGSSGAVAIQSGTAETGGTGNLSLLTGNSAQNSSGLIQIKSGDGYNDSGDVTINTGVLTGSGTTGSVSLSTAQAGSGSSTGAINMNSGSVSSGSGTSGAITFNSGTTISGASGLVSITSGNSTSGVTGGITLESGSSSANTGDVVIESGNSSAGNSGNFSFITGDGLNSGSIALQSGSATSGTSGGLNLFSGPGITGSGVVLIRSGNVTTGNSGSVQIYSGNSTSGNAGHIFIDAGDGVVDGNVNISAGTDGYVNITASGAGKTKIFGDGYVSQDFEIVGKLTVGGLIDPTGLKLTPQASEPDGESTIWVSSVDGYLYYNGIVGGSSPNKRLLSEGYTDTDDIINSSTVSGLTLTDALNALSSVAPTLSNVLDNGNTTDGYDIRISNGDELVFEDVGTIRMDGYDDFDILFTNSRTGSQGAGINITTQQSTNNLSGELSIVSGNSSGNSTGSGGVFLMSGSFSGSVIATTGNAVLASGDNTSSTAGTTGHAYVRSGDAPDGTAGNVNIFSGYGSVASGNINLTNSVGGGTYVTSSKFQVKDLDDSSSVVLTVDGANSFNVLGSTINPKFAVGVSGGPAIDGYFTGNLYSKGLFSRELTLFNSLGSEPTAAASKPVMFTSTDGYLMYNSTERGNFTLSQELVVDALTIDGYDDESFTLSRFPMDASKVLLFADGVLQKHSVDFSISGKTLTWLNSIPLDTGDVLTAVYMTRDKVN